MNIYEEVPDLLRLFFSVRSNEKKFRQKSNTQGEVIGVGRKFIDSSFMKYFGKPFDQLVTTTSQYLFVLGESKQLNQLFKYSKESHVKFSKLQMSETAHVIHLATM